VAPRLALFMSTTLVFIAYLRYLVMWTGIRDRR
jgi:hypothetical protein